MGRPLEQPLPEQPHRKERVQLDFTPGALSKLDELKDLIGASTRADTIRQALRLFSWFMHETDPDDTITITNKSGDIVARFTASLIHSEQKSSNSTSHPSIGGAGTTG